MAVEHLVPEVVQAILIPTLVVPVVVIDGSAQRIKDGTTARLDEIYHIIIVESFTANAVIVDCATCIVEGDEEGFCGIINRLRTNDGSLVGFIKIDAERGMILRGLKDRIHIRCAPQMHLLCHLHVALLSPRHILVQEKLHAQVVAMLIGLFIGDLQGHSNGLCLARLDGRHPMRGLMGNGGAADIEAVTDNDDADIYIIQGNEIVLVGHLQAYESHLLARGQLTVPNLIQLHAHVLIDVFHIVVFRLGREVGQHDAIHAEHPVVGQVAEVAAISKKPLSGSPRGGEGCVSA